MTIDESKLFILAAGIIIDPKGRLLIVRKQDTQKYMLPGGKIDAGETPIQALMRELYEEVNIQIPPALAHFIKEYEAPAANEPGYFIRSNLFFILLPEAVNITPASEIAEALWITPQDIPNFDFAPLMTSFVIPTWLDLIENMGPSLGFDLHLNA
ncbi:NUDIX hydrolase [Ignatzschineria sp. LJL83]